MNILKNGKWDFEVTEASPATDLMDFLFGKNTEKKHIYRKYKNRKIINISINGRLVGTISVLYKHEHKDPPLAIENALPIEIFNTEVVDMYKGHVRVLEVPAVEISGLKIDENLSLSDKQRVFAMLTLHCDFAASSMGCRLMFASCTGALASLYISKFRFRELGKIAYDKELYSLMYVKLKTPFSTNAIDTVNIDAEWGNIG